MAIFNWINGQAGGTPLSAENLNQMQINLLEMIFPVGSTYITQTNTNPNSVLGIGTWERFNGKIALGVDDTDENMNTIGQTGGEKEHVLTVDELPAHNHPSNNYFESSGGTPNIWAVRSVDGLSGWKDNGTSIGGSQPHNNIQPYEIVGYMWIRRS